MIRAGRRRRWAGLLGIAAAWGAAACGAARPALPAVPGSGARLSPPVTVVILRVVDGDTFHATVNGSDERIRLIGVDTPEIARSGEPAECFGNEAAAYATSRLTGAVVTLSFDVDGRDRYGRLLAYVRLVPEGELFNLTLVRLGYATADPVPPDTRMADAFFSAQEEARAAGRGRWSACPASA